ncbi:MAG TPA: proprotein convertase P-domain-containing protein, partial [Kofleriaceae bacterium]|nr:proprotein convertase P-domain-containing protein [Kofleriaceae bacterium]
YPSTSPVGWENNTSTDDYHYILELNSDGKVVGGRYCKDSTNTHIDFLWSPTGSNSPSNPNVDATKVKQLIKLSVEPDQGGGGTSGGTTRDFPVTPNTSIPDNTPAGVNVDIPVTGVTAAKGLAVSVDITHTYRGDLVLTLLKNGTKVKTLVQNVGGSADNLQETYTLTAAEIGTDVNTKWTLNVADTEAQDVGTVNKVTLSFTL